MHVSGLRYSRGKYKIKQKLYSKHNISDQRKTQTEKKKKVLSFVSILTLSNNSHQFTR